MKNLVNVIFFGNIFYGIIAVFMCIETNLLHGLSINHFPFYLLIFFGSWLYYTMIYVRSIHPASVNTRIIWYRQNLSSIRKILYVVLFIESMLVSILLYWHVNALVHVSWQQWLLAFTIPVVAALYTFKSPLPFIKKFRQVGWLKPFIVGFTWSGWVTFYPILVWQLQYGYWRNKAVLPTALFWLSNFIFITILAIIFDVKDYSSDVRHKLKTFPAQYGIVNAYRYIIIPATLLNIAVAVAFIASQHFTFAQAIIQLLPYGVLLVISTSAKKERSIYHYLVVIDGLMLLKALCGIISIEYF